MNKTFLQRWLCNDGDVAKNRWQINLSSVFSHKNKNSIYENDYIVNHYVLIEICFDLMISPIKNWSQYKHVTHNYACTCMYVLCVHKHPFELRWDTGKQAQ